MKYYLVKKCTKCGVEKTLDCFSPHKGRKYNITPSCKKCRAKSTSRWRKNNPEKAKEWVENNKERVREYRRKWEKNPERREYCRKWRYNKYHSDENFRMNIIIRSALQRTLAYNHRSCGTFEILGYTIEDFKKKIEYQFTEGMSWEKVGPEIHIDHKIPVDYFEKKGESRAHIVHALCNLQPMWGPENQKKSNKLDFQG